MGRRGYVLADQLPQPAVRVGDGLGLRHLQPGYRYGFEAANRFEDRDWNDVEPELSTGWKSYAHRGASTWEQMKDAVRDAWDRVTGNRRVGVRS
jgi:hypothetical protein